MCPGKMHAEEVVIGVPLVRRLVAAQFPEWADLHIERVPSSGTVNAMFRLGSDMVVRMPRVHWHATEPEREQHWLPRLAPHLPLEIPRPLALGRSGEGYEWPWSVFPWIEGETWAADRVGEISEAAVELADFVTALQGIDTTDAPRSPRSKLAHMDEFVRKSIAASRDVIDADAVTTAWNAALALPPYEGPWPWVHTDLWRPGNLLVRDGRLVAVLDFGPAGTGDPAVDLVAAWSLFSGPSRGAFRDALPFDEQTWARARGWALTGVIAIPYYTETNPEIVAEALRKIEEVLEEEETR